MKFEQKHLAIILAVVAVLYIRYKRKGYIFKPNEFKKSDEEIAPDLTKYDLGECDFRSNGISVFNINYTKKTFNYLAVADNESIQGLFEWDRNGELRDPNSQGKFSSSTGWVLDYSKKVNGKNQFATITLANPKKKAMFNKVVDFTNKRIG